MPKLPKLVYGATVDVALSVGTVEPTLVGPTLNLTFAPALILAPRPTPTLNLAPSVTLAPTLTFFLTLTLTLYQVGVGGAVRVLLLRRRLSPLTVVASPFKALKLTPPSMLPSLPPPKGPVAALGLG